MSDPIPVCDLKAHVSGIRAELDAAIARVLESGWFILGEELRQFEAEFAGFVGQRHCLGVASGTDAIHLAIRALGLGPGDWVLTAPNSAVPTACGISEAGATPCFADVDLEDGLLDPGSVSRQLDRLGSKVKAIMAVHLYGRAARLAELSKIAQERGIPFVEDVAQAHGANRLELRAGTIGALSCFSFYPTKNLGAFGDAGAITTDSPELARRIVHLRNYGQEDRYHHVTLGFNSRLDEIQAAILRVELAHLPAWTARRRAIAARYRAGFAGLPLALAPERPEAPSVEHLFVVRVDDRDRFRAALEASGVATQIHYPLPIHLQPAYAGLNLGPGSFPIAERRAREVVSLPMYPEMTEDQIDRVIDAVRSALRGAHPPTETPS
ncbi:MAG: DegT/DnrJ/EryC1/StrS family aminotransferase [Candidatus Eisenbacteria bacterium]|uniref:DegT/DnrJ/EryC1/StrS family aminotransferase n=1 Tax=Eiseniibacteriota bacterium TaxID=2212470 RepID=A0A956RNH5_UNCEI|nr:DegT/DnrJ/EryC1/StrS family aminotransferase [Candidatus Eisenbacteria bacterium]